MRWLSGVIAMPIFLLCIGTAWCGEFNRVLKIGGEAPAWKELTGIDGHVHDYDELSAAKFVVVVFTCNSCPYAVDTEKRLLALSAKASELGGKLVAINVNTIEEDALPAMRDHASAKNFTYPYLYDPTQGIAKAFGATTTPEFYVLGPTRKVIYMGSLDDSPDGSAVTRRHVDAAIEAMLASKQPEVTETIPIGCRIRFTRTRK